MATTSSAADAAAAGAAPECPVMAVLTRRIRALRKKLNRILQMEESLADGKVLLREQEELLRSKPTVLALIDELERLRPPLAEAADAIKQPSTPPSPPEDEPQNDGVADLVSLLYFSSLFDVRLQGELGKATMLAREHERGCCLTYDYVTEDAPEADLLVEADLDAVADLGVLVTSRPIVAGGVSHKDALQGCVTHARNWLEGADVPIQPGGSVTYAGLRAKLNKILASDYYTIATEMKSPGDVAAAVGQYVGLQAPEDTSVMHSEVDDEGVQLQDDLKEEEPSSPDVVEHLDQQHQDDAAEDSPKDEVVNQHVEKPQAVKAAATADGDVAEAYQNDADPRDQQHMGRRPYQNQRGGRGGFRRGGGYVNGRGRGGRNGYQNGRGQYYESGYYPRNHYPPRGRGSRYNNYGGQQQQHAAYAQAGEG